MKHTSYQEALDAFANPLHEFTVEPVTTGLINHSFKVTSKNTGGSFLLQQINQQVFTDPEKLQTNYELLWKHLQEEQIPFTIPEPKYFVDDTTFYCDSRNRYWRVFEYMYGTASFSVPKNIQQVTAVTGTFAEFTACFRDFDTEQLHITIPGFHSISARFSQFKNALKNAAEEKLEKTAGLVAHLLQRERYANLYDVFTVSEEFPLRVMHHDAKISNILFDEDSGIVVCPVDLDTVMPGYFFSDLGDMVRSMVCLQNENSTDLENICIQQEFYAAILSVYTGILNDQLTVSEKKYIHCAGLFMIYMQALRFITDYFNGDLYYRTSYPDQNFDRAMNQCTLLLRLEEFLLKEYNFSI